MTLNSLSSTQQKLSFLAAALLASALLNLFLVGVLAGLVPGTKGGHHFAPMALAARHGELMDQWLERSLNPADADVFRSVLEPQAAALKQAHEHVRLAMQDVAKVFEQDPPNPSALQDALGRVKQAKAEVNDVVGAIIGSIYTRLSPDGRKRLAEMTR